MAKPGRKRKDEDEPFRMAEFWDKLFSWGSSDYHELCEHAVIGVSLNIAVNLKSPKWTIEQFAQCVKAGRNKPRHTVYGWLGKAGKPQRLNVADAGRIAECLGTDLNGLMKTVEYAVNSEIRKRKLPIELPRPNQPIE